MCQRAARPRKGTPVARRGRKAWGLERYRVSPAAEAHQSTKGTEMLARIRTAAEEREGGFTLIELLVVIIIIGILAAIAIPVFLNQRQKGYDAQAKSDARNLATLEETYMTDFSHYKTEASAAVASTGALADLGYKPSSNVTTLAIKTYDAATPPAVATDGVGGYCIDVTSGSGKHFFYDSFKGGLATACT